MSKARQGLAFYVALCFIAFIISKIVIAILLYKRWKRKHLVFLKKTLKLNTKDIIGSGGYGTVYKITIDESSAFAVKRLSRGTADRERGFERELEAMGDLKHRNIVTLHGYYTSPCYNLLIYELMHNGKDKREEYVLDSSLKNCPTEEINNVFRIAFVCLEPDPSNRPTMAQIVKMLE
ncbi:hypothetical protein Tsubulata_000932, partial [Turnera subulata]